MPSYLQYLRQSISIMPSLTAQMVEHYWKLNLSAFHDQGLFHMPKLVEQVLFDMSVPGRKPFETLFKIFRDAVSNNNNFNMLPDGAYHFFNIHIETYPQFSL